MKKYLAPLVVLLTMCHATVDASVPRLVVLLSVEELRSDILEALAPHLPSDGLSKFVKEGFYCRSLSNPLYSPSETGSVATLHTGTSAVVNGVAGRHIFVRDASGSIVGERSVFADSRYMGFATTDRFSPQALTSPTISDRLHEASRGRSLIYAIAPRAEEAIVAGGKNPSGVFWVDDYNGKWVTSTYYKGGFPWFVEKSNEGEDGAPNFIKTSQWSPSNSTPLYRYPFGEFPYAFNEEKDRRFKYSFDLTGGGISRFKTSGLINEHIARLVKKVISHTPLGQDVVPDLLSIHLYAGPYAEKPEEMSAELLDTYLRLDRVVAELRHIILSRVRREEVLFVLVGSTHATPSLSVSEAMGSFDVVKCKALLNMFLMARWGHSNWIQDISTDGQVFLDRKGIEKVKVDLEEVRESVADFLLDFSGVRYAVSDHILRTWGEGRDFSPLFLSCLNKAPHKLRGDVVFEILPGWHYVGGRGNGTGTSSHGIGILSPFALLLPNTASEECYTPIDLGIVSSVVCSLLRIRPPTQEVNVPEEINRKIKTI